MSPFRMRSPWSLRFSPPAWRRAALGAFAGALCAAVGGAGCGGSQPKPQNPAGAVAASNVPGAPLVDRSRCSPEGKQAMVLDTNRDKKPDVWKYFIAGTGGAQVLACKRQDLDHDGNIDSIYYYDATGTQVTLEEFNLDFDGRIDQRVYWANGKKVRIERDFNFDDKPDVWDYYEDGRLVRIERDTDNDGRVDQWEYWEGGKLDRIGYDTSGSGRVDRWDRAPEGGDDMSAAVAAGAAAGGGTSAPPSGAVPAAATAPAQPASIAPPPPAPAPAPKKK
jgi:hypothetical protein